MAETLLNISVNGLHLERPFGNFPPGCLLEGTLPEEAASSSSGIYVVETPLDQYYSAREAIERQDGAEIDLGDLNTVTQRGVQRFELRVKHGVLYDCFNLHSQTFLDTARMVGGLQIPPNELTLEEVTLLMVVKSGFSLDQVKGVKATVIADKVHLYNRNQLLHFGLQVGDMVATLSSQSNFGLVHSYKDRSRLFDLVSDRMFANNLRAQAGFSPL